MNCIFAALRAAPYTGKHPTMQEMVKDIQWFSRYAKSTNSLILLRPPTKPGSVIECDSSLLTGGVCSHQVLHHPDRPQAGEGPGPGRRPEPKTIRLSCGSQSRCHLPQPRHQQGQNNSQLPVPGHATLAGEYRQLSASLFPGRPDEQHDDIMRLFRTGLAGGTWKNKTHQAITYLRC